MKNGRFSRRGFLNSTAGALAASGAVTSALPAIASPDDSEASFPTKLPMRTLGQTGVAVSILGLGGGGRGRNPQICGTPNRPKIQELAEQILDRALNAGVNYIDMFLKAKEEGIARYIGITVHSSRAVIEATLQRCRERGIEMDTLLMAFNVTDVSSGGHGSQVLRAYPKIGKIAMKVFGSDGAPVVHREGISAQTALRYVLSHGFSTAIIGTHTLEELEENLETVRNFEPYSPEEMSDIESRILRRKGKVWTLSA